MLTDDEGFAEQCREWLKAGAEAMETKLWNNGYYLTSVSSATTTTRT